MKNNMTKNKQYGAVSLFVVVFAALLITVVTVSFVRIMVSDQQQASTTDLSQSAYDSAQAGVEDAKRALLRKQSACIKDGETSLACTTAKADISSTTCNKAVKTLDDVQAAADKSKNGEINVQVGSNNNDLDQAYTCVIITPDTADYLGELVKDSSKLIPLYGVSNFDKVKIEWFSPSNLAAPAVKAVIPKSAAGVPLSSNWSSNQPPIMRAGLTQFANTGFTLSEFDNNTANASSNTLFLYPSDITDTTSFASDLRRTPKPLGLGTPVRVTCNDLSAGDEYACSATLSLPVASGIDHTQYLDLSSLYNKTSYRISLLNGALPVKFNGVQPSVDSTGRANDLFRRVETRVEMTDVNFPYPNAAVDTTGNLCKNFTVTDDPKDYNGNTTCTP